MAIGMRGASQSGSAADAARMPLLEHLRELRSRLIRAVLAIGLGAVVGWFIYDRIVHALISPVCQPGVAGVAAAEAAAASSTADILTG